MAKRSRHRTGRPRAGEERLTPERIFSAALALIDAAGVEGLSMRRLAQALDVDPMALYRHVPDKDGIIRGVVRLVFAGFPSVATEIATEIGTDGHTDSEASALSWQAQVHAFADAFYALAAAHPHVVLYLVTHAEISEPAVLAVSEQLCTILARAGFNAEQVIVSADLIIDYLNGYILAAQSGRFGSGEERREMLELLAQMPPGAFPTLQRVMREADPAAIAPDFQQGLALILAGIAARYGAK